MCLCLFGPYVPMFSCMNRSVLRLVRVCIYLKCIRLLTRGWYKHVNVQMENTCVNVFSRYKLVSRACLVGKLVHMCLVDM